MWCPLSSPNEQELTLDFCHKRQVSLRTARNVEAVKASDTARRFLRIADVQASVGLSAGCIYKMVKRREFPAPVKLTTRSSAWLASEIDLWIDGRSKARRQDA